MEKLAEMLLDELDLMRTEAEIALFRKALAERLPAVVREAGECAREVAKLEGENQSGGKINEPISKNKTG